MSDWKEWLFRVAIFIAGGSLGAVIMALLLAARRPAEPPRSRVRCGRCGSLWWFTPKVQIPGCAACCNVGPALPWFLAGGTILDHDDPLPGIQPAKPWPIPPHPDDAGTPGVLSEPAD
jgi:hypothetical protein